MKLVLFEDAIVDVTKKVRKIPTSDYFETGLYKIIDQSPKPFIGFSDLEEGFFEDDAVIFGDHTRNIKYAEPPFFIGADGVKVLVPREPKQFITKYAYYNLKFFKLKNLGYNRHFKLLKEKSLVFRDIQEQKRIILLLDSIQNLISKNEKEVELFDELIISRFYSITEGAEKVPLCRLINPYTAERCGDRKYEVLSITMHDGLVKQSERFKKEIASEDKSNYKVVPFNTLVVAFPIDEGLLSVQDLVDFGIVSPAYSTFSIKTEIVNPNFLEYVLRSEKSIAYYKAHLKSTTLRRRTIPKEDFDNMPIPFPDKKIQDQFIAFCKQIEADKEKTLAKIESLKEMFDKYMNDFFGGIK